MISIDSPYTQMIFNGYKLFEFRDKVIKGMNVGYPLEDIKAYIYEKKDKGGCGKVIGEIDILGSYELHYGNKKKADTELVKERFTFIKELYLGWCDIKGIKPNMNEGWFKSKKFLSYQHEIGFFGDRDCLSCNYALILNNYNKYEIAKDISLFLNIKGFPLQRPPKNMVRVLDRVSGPSQGNRS